MSDADTIREMLAAWNKLEADARAMYPTASNERIYQMVAAAMSKAVGL